MILIQITCEKSVFNVVYMNPNEFPELPSINEELRDCKFLKIY